LFVLVFVAAYVVRFAFVAVYVVRAFVVVVVAVYVVVKLGWWVGLAFPRLCCFRGFVVSEALSGALSLSWL